MDDEPVLSPKVHASDPPARHAPKDLNPDQLGWNQSCCRYTRDVCLSAEAARLELASGSHRHLFSRQAPHPAGWLPTASCGSWNRTNGLLVQSQASLPTATIPQCSANQDSRRKSRFAIRSTPSGNRTRSASFKGSRRDYAPERVSCGSRTRLAGLEDRSLCRSAKDTSCFKRKVRESNPQGREARPGSSGVPSPVGLTFRKAAEAGIEPASGRVTTACPYQHEHHRIIQSGRSDLNRRSRAPKTRGMPGFPTS